MPVMRHISPNKSAKNPRLEYWLWLLAGVVLDGVSHFCSHLISERFRDAVCQRPLGTYL